jgi:hypothetical protein
MVLWGRIFRHDVLKYCKRRQIFGVLHNEALICTGILNFVKVANWWSSRSIVNRLTLQNWNRHGTSLDSCRRSTWNASTCRTIVNSAGRHLVRIIIFVDKFWNARFLQLGCGTFCTICSTNDVLSF